MTKLLRHLKDFRLSTKNSLINLDFADVTTVMKDKGLAHVGIGSAKGDEKALEAVKAAVASPLLETSIQGATDVIVNICGDVGLNDANEATSYVQDMTGADANIILGITVDESMDDEVSVTVIATGLGEPVATPTGAFRNSAGMVYNAQPRQSSAEILASMNRAAAPAGQAGVTNPTPVVNRPVTPTPAIQKPVTPVAPTESSVPELNIKMPDFMSSIKK